MMTFALYIILDIFCRLIICRLNFKFLFFIYLLIVFYYFKHLGAVPKKLICENYFGNIIEHTQIWLKQQMANFPFDLVPIIILKRIQTHKNPR